MPLTIPTLLTCILCCQLSIALGDTSAPTTQPDLSTPLAAVVAFFQASSAGDENAARQVVVLDDATGRLLDAVFSADHAHRDLVNAAIAHFGPSAKAKTGFDPNAFLVQMAREGKTTIHGDTADIGDDGNFPCRLIDGKWRYDLVRLHAHDPIDKTIAYEKQITDYDEKFAKDIAAGKYASLDELTKAYGANAPQPPPPPKP